MSTLTAIRSQIIPTNEAHVRVAFENYKRTNPELVGELIDTACEVSFSLFVPALGEALIYRALLCGDAA